MPVPTRDADRSERRGDRPGGPAADSGDAAGGGPRRGRRTGLRLRRRAVVLLLVLALLLGSFGVWALYGSSWLRIEHVSVSGAGVLTEKQIRDAAAIPLGSPLVSLDKSAAERRLRDRLPRIRTAEVVRAWPHGVGLKVTERKPELVQEKAGKYVEVDAEGVRFATVGKRPKGVPLLVVESGRPAAARHFTAERLRRAAVRAATAAPAAVAEDIRSVHVRSYDSLTLELTGGRTVLWGSGERGAAKAKALKALMKAAKDARHFDVSVPSAPSTMPS
ncbi:cell division protein FtsQ [Streptomyces armeniacus]|uniref:Cell division protein FtsQ n=1 Tax=Streptomyces armeniacus TaxID=83291 RepID=A0A345XLY1_9ACTN|nr:FtsQ-type POTRA domain-containing protein [Streptomyces armeniacus]AXK32647.1 cell division protein FtsQ [Streptomyces armeniacus]